jgi:hypothetical protein
MKCYRTIFITLLLTVFLFSVSIVCAEKKMYDDFSTGRLDGSKWRQREYVREIVNGEFIFKLGNRSPGMGAEVTPGIFRNNLPIANPEAINSIECEITIVEAQLDSSIGSKSFIRIAGYFYNKNDTGGATGDIFAQLMIGDQGNGKIEAFWEIHEMLTDDTKTWIVIGNGTIDNFDTSVINPPYRVKLSYDGDKTFSFSVNDIYTDSFANGPDKRRDAVTSWKDISAGINATDGSNNGYIFGKIDNVYVNDENTVYDDFSELFVDWSKWKYSEWVREASGGYLSANSLGFGSTDSSTTHLSYKSTPYLEAKVRIDSTSQLSAGAIGVGRIQGYYYNDRRGPGSGQEHNMYEGDVLAQVRLRYDGDGVFSAEAFVHRSDDANESSFTNLFSHTFAALIDSDIFYALSICFEGDKLIFGCAGEAVEYDITTPIYPAYGIHRHLRSVIYLDDPGEAGYINISYDDVNVETFLCDFQPFDGDVDGSDLVAFLTDNEGISPSEFAEEFGQINRP